jgi:AcrR family transcriptional regulator
MAADPQRRPHTGRRRNPAVRQAILECAADLLIEQSDTQGEGLSGAGVSMDAIARAAGVSKHTIYRWWPSKGAVLLEAMVERARRETTGLGTGVLAVDLEAFLTATFQAVERVGPLLRGIMAESLRDPVAAEGLREFTAGRRDELRELLATGLGRGELPAGTDLELMIDQIYGLMWYRFLFGHAPLSAEAAAALTRALTVPS